MREMSVDGSNQQSWICLLNAPQRPRRSDRTMPKGRAEAKGAAVAGRHQAQIGVKRRARRTKGRRRGPQQHDDTTNPSGGSSRLRGGVALRSVRLIRSSPVVLTGWGVELGF